MKRRFSKPPTTCTDQVARLQSRGMIIADTDEVEFYLQHISYYRLTAYWLPFEADHQTHRFKPGTRFEAVFNLYVFDRELRLLMLDAIERIEVSLRTQWAYHMGHRHGPHSHLNSSLAKNHSRWHDNVDRLKEEVSRSSERFIDHFQSNYQEGLPPVWACAEVMSLGLLSRWYDNHGPRTTRKAVSRTYALSDDVLESWLRHLSHVRNLCAHHGRLWNRQLTVTPNAPRSRSQPVAIAFQPGARQIYNTLLITLHLMDNIAPGHHWRSRLGDLVAHHNIDLHDMGFPDRWERQPIWNQGGDHE